MLVINKEKMKDFVNINLNNTKSVSYDEGLRVYMNTIYKYMSFALLISGLVAYFVANFPPLFNLFFRTPLSIVVMCSPLLYEYIRFNSCNVCSASLHILF